MYPQMRLLRKITYGEFSEFFQEKKITYNTIHIYYIYYMWYSWENVVV